MRGRTHTSVLVVDDEEQFLDVVSQRLEGRGLEVVTATSGREAVKAIQEKAFDTVVLDLVMPGMGGIETLRQLRECQPDLQVIVLTGHGSIEAGIEAMKLGAEDMIEKPVDLKVLLERIQEASRERISQSVRAGKG